PAFPLVAVSAAASCTDRGLDDPPAADDGQDEYSLQPHRCLAAPGGIHRRVRRKQSLRQAPIFRGSLSPLAAVAEPVPFDFPGIAGRAFAARRSVRRFRAAGADLDPSTPG